MKFSVLMAVYKNDNHIYFKRALQSLTEQLLKPDEIVLVEDGPLNNELYMVIESLRGHASIKLKVVKLNENCGLGTALAVGLENCSHEIVARMDSDDVCRYDRFEKQLEFLDKNRDVDIVGSYITEFENDEKNILFARKVPLDRNELTKYAKKRSPMNHVSVVFKRSSVMKAGNYHRGCVSEDWCLWGRMLQNGCVFANIPEYLVNVRAGTSMYKRRGGWRVLAALLKLQLEFFKNGFLGYSDFIINVFVRSIAAIVPVKIRKIVYENFLRSGI